MNTENSEKVYTLEDLNYFWTKSGVPCFMADRDGIEDIVESLGYNIYYLIANIAEDRKIENKVWEKNKQVTTTTWVTDLNTSIVKVVNNFVGRSLSKVEKEDIYDFTPVREEATYNLPAIPRIIVDKLDEFFRLVEAQHGTESIVMLTFDPQFAGSSQGWGILVPDQQNTSVHCKYDPDSVVDQKPEHVMIVGSVHSHPNMAAYASGTDHADQADFDGLHITYGWQKSINNGATQYHIEMQIGGVIYTLKPEDVFEDILFTKDPDPEVIEWSEKVKKALPPTGGMATPAASTQPHSPPQLLTQKHSPIPTDYTQAGIASPVIGDSSLQQIPFPVDVKNFLVIAEISIAENSDNLYCPSCDIEIFGYGTEFVCPTCDILLCLDSDLYTDILQSADQYLKIRNLPIDSNIYLWTQDENKNNTLLLLRDNFLNSHDSADSILLSETKQDPNLLDEYFYEGFDSTRTVCCNESIDSLRLGECDCVNPVYYDKVIEFDNTHPYNVYDSNSDCADCEYYYSRSCSPYLISILEYARNNQKLDFKISSCKDFTPYHSSYSYDLYERD
jgi:hypothetical protein